MLSRFRSVWVCPFEPNAVQYLPDGARVLMVAGLLPLNIVLPDDLADEATEDVAGGGTYGHQPEDAVRVTARA